MVMYTITGIGRGFQAAAVVYKNIRHACFAVFYMVMFRFTVRNCRRVKCTHNQRENENQPGEHMLHTPSVAASAIFGKHFIIQRHFL